MSLFRKKEAVLSLPIDGMHCEMCAANLKRGLVAVNGIKKAEVSFAEKKADVTYDAEKITPEAIAAAVEEIGYHVAK